MKSKNRARKYLMDLLPEEERKNTEDLYFRDNNFFAEILDTEEELIEQYINNKLGKKDRNLFEQRFLNTNDKVKRIGFEKILITEIKNQKNGLSSQNRKQTFKSKLRNIWKRLTSKTLKIVAILIALIVVAITSYLIIQKVNKNNASTISYENPKIDELRISFFDPEVNIRGEKQEIINKFLIDVKTASGSDIYLYIFYFDKDKNITTLFPNSKLSKLANPFKPKQTYRFPSSDGSYGTTNMHKSDIIMLIGTFNPWEEMEKKILLLEREDKTEKSTLNSGMKQLIVNAHKSNNFYIKIYTIEKEPLRNEYD